MITFQETYNVETLRIIREQVFCVLLKAEINSTLEQENSVNYHEKYGRKLFRHPPRLMKFWSTYKLFRTSFRENDRKGYLCKTLKIDIHTRHAMPSVERDEH